MPKFSGNEIWVAPHVLNLPVKSGRESRLTVTVPPPPVRAWGHAGKSKYWKDKTRHRATNSKLTGELVDKSPSPRNSTGTPFWAMGGISVKFVKLASEPCGVPQSVTLTWPPIAPAKNDTRAAVIKEIFISLKSKLIPALMLN